MAIKSAEHAQATYDKVANDYDDLWSRHVAEPNARLTRGLKLRRGERIADLACGTAVFTLDMARAVDTGETVGVDYSEGMLTAARDRFASEGRALTLEHAKAEDFVIAAPPASFDAVSLRFALAYLDWRDVLPRLGRMLRPGGRVGVLTSLTGSIPQARELYTRMMESFGEAVVPSPVPDSSEQAAELIARGGLEPEDVWTCHLKLWFESGTQAAHWMRESGYASHPSMQQIDPAAMDSLEALFAAGLESFREVGGVPLDITIGGVIARKS